LALPSCCRLRAGRGCAGFRKAAPIKIAVFDFELEDVSPAASQAGASGDSAAIMQKVSSEARRLLAQSGRYTLVDVSKSDAKPVIEKRYATVMAARPASRRSWAPTRP
jgi:hypothetical protein